MSGLEIKNLSVSVEGKPIVKKLSITLQAGELHALMGPNASGKTSLALALIGHPKYAVSGQILLDGNNILALKPEERAKRGLFLSFQNPTALSGVSVAQLLRAAWLAEHGEASANEFFARLEQAKTILQLNDEFLHRPLNVEFSGGEKKRAEILQLLVLKPKFAIIDEIDSGLDVDALKLVAQAIEQVRRSGTGILLITHYNRILKHLKPDQVHILIEGELSQSGSAELAEFIETTGYSHA